MNACTLEKRSNLCTVRTLTTSGGFPEELLSYILLFTSESSHSGTVHAFRPTKAPLLLRGVCRDWRDALSRCPRFWATVLASAADEDAWEAILSRSGAVPLRLSTVNRVPLRLQANVIPRTEEAYITRDDGTVSWSSVLTRAGELFNLSTLHLSRHLGIHIHEPMITIRAPNLRILTIDCNATIFAPALVSIKITHSSNIPQFFRAVLDGCPNLVDFHFVRKTCSNSSLWVQAFEELHKSSIQNLTITLARAAWISPRHQAIPTVRSICTNVPCPIASPALEYLNADLCVDDVLYMLRRMQSLRTVIVRGGSQKRASDVLPYVILPLCERIVWLPRVGHSLVVFVNHAYFPHVTDFDLHFDVATMSDWTAVWEPAHGRYFLSDDQSSSGCRVKVSRTQLREDVSCLQDLSVRLREMTSGPVSLFLSTRYCAELETVDFTFRAEDTLSRNSSKPGISITATKKRVTCDIDHTHSDSIPVAHTLCAFAWPTVDKICLSSMTEINTGSPFMDAFSTPQPEDEELLIANLRLLSGVRHLSIEVCSSVEENGLSLLRTLARPTCARVWPKLSTIQIEARKDGSCVSLLRGTWWREISNAIEARSILSDDVLPISIVLKGHFCAGYDDVEISTMINEMRGGLLSVYFVDCAFCTNCGT